MPCQPILLHQTQNAKVGHSQSGYFRVQNTNRMRHWVYMGNTPRLADNPLLSRAIATGEPLLLLAEWATEPDQLAPPACHIRHKIKLAVFAKLKQQVIKAGGRIIFLRPNWADHLAELASILDTPAAIWLPEAIGPVDTAEFERVTRWANASAVPVHKVWCGTLLAVEDMPYLPEHHEDDFDLYRVKTARFCPIRPPLAPIEVLNRSNIELQLLTSLSGLIYDEAIPHHFEFESSLPPAPATFFGSQAANYYTAERATLATRYGTSGIGPGLASGYYSPRQVYADLEKHSSKAGTQSLFEDFRQQLLLRDHFRFLAFKYVELLEDPSGVLQIPIRWNHAPDWLTAWQTGNTGVPIVDAIMRELATMGSISHRARLIAGHFLVRYLGINWLAGAAWFEQTLTDFDAASNTLNWMQIAGVFSRKRFGFQYLDPIVQAAKHDPQGEYVRKWCSELNQLGAKWIHTPWLLSAERLRSKGITLGKEYPKLICGNLDDALEAAHLAYKRAAQEADLRYGRPLIRKFVSTQRDKTVRKGVKFR